MVEWWTHPFFAITGPLIVITSVVRIREIHASIKVFRLSIYAHRHIVLNIRLIPMKINKHRNVPGLEDYLAKSSKSLLLLLHWRTLEYLFWGLGT